MNLDFSNKLNITASKQYFLKLSRTHGSRRAPLQAQQEVGSKRQGVSVNIRNNKFNRNAPL